jgi:hypothetical protein
MGSIWIRDFTGGLDARRMAEATTGGVLVKARNGHITSGNEFEQRAAFVPEYTLPGGTVGMAAAPDGIYVFGHGSTPSLPTGIRYQRLQHSDGTTALVRVLSADLYQGKLYVVGEFADGTIFHFYDGARVTDWFDGCARATFEVTGGAVTTATAARGSFEIVGGATGTITSIKIDGVELLGATVTHTGNNATTAEAVVDEINDHLSSPDYIADVDGQTVIIVAASPGTGPNGKAIIVTQTGDMDTDNFTVMAGGSGSASSRMADIKINGVSIISAPVDWSTSNESTATAIAAAINGYTSSPDYEASAVGAVISIKAVTPGPNPNGYAVVFYPQLGFTVWPATGLTLTNGATSTNTYQPGNFVRTIGQKVYATSGPNMHFSGVRQPTKWTTDAVGAGFIDMSSESSGSEELMALSRYQNYVAVFAARTIQIWYTDPDPSLNRQTQVLNNTGTEAPRSVTQFGDTDIFYLDQSGLRSLRARSTTDAASTTDIGVPVDPLIMELVNDLDENEMKRVTGLIEPASGRFWLIMRNKAFVFSFFSGAKVSAWSTYDLSYIDENDTTVSFEIDTAVAFERRVYIRSGFKIFVYGGLATGAVHDATEAEAWTAYLDGDAPTKQKQFRSIDAAIRGQWTISPSINPDNEEAEELVSTLPATSYWSDGRIPFNSRATHVALRFRSKGVGPHRLGACVITYDKIPDED